MALPMHLSRHESGSLQTPLHQQPCPSDQATAQVHWTRPASDGSTDSTQPAGEKGDGALVLRRMVMPEQRQ